MTTDKLKQYRKAMRAVFVSKSLEEAKDAVRPLIEEHADGEEWGPAGTDPMQLPVDNAADLSE